MPEQNALLLDEQFSGLLMLHVPADDFDFAQVLSALHGQPADYWPIVNRPRKCGDLVTNSAWALPQLDGYNFDGFDLERILVKSGLRSETVYDVTLTGSPEVVPIQQKYLCLVNTPAMSTIAPGQDLHSELQIPFAQRFCKRWTYANHYDTELPGKGMVHVLAGTFSYVMSPTMGGEEYKGDGTGSVKMYLDPDNGRWTVVELQLHDPDLTIGRLHFERTPGIVPGPTDCPGP